MSSFSRHWNAIRSALSEEKLRARKLVGVDEISFLPAAMEIIERPVSPTSRVTSWLLIMGLVFTVVWVTFGKIDVVASAQGKLIPADSVKIIQPAQDGLVRAILVHDGQHVARGQALIELDPTVSTAETVQAERALETAELDAARSRAVLLALDGNGLRFTPPAGTSPEMAAIQRELARAQLADVTATAGARLAERQVAVAAKGEASVQAAKLTETLPLLDEQIDANEHLLARGFVSKLKVIEMRRQRLSAARDRDIAYQTARKATAQIASAKSSMSQNAAEVRTKILTELTKSEDEARLRREELTKARQKSSLQRLISPVDGTIAQLAIHTVGGVVEAAKPIMVVVPSTGVLIAEVKVLNKDAGFIKAGQEAAIKLEAFPFTRYGTVPGKVESVSSDSIEDQKLGSIYTVRVILGRETLLRDASMVPLTPGMAVIADLRTGRRSIISYLMSPVNEARLNAGHER
ncbi:HlyD family type I secretion periplasmic adaptor subunit [Sphingomonas sp. CFBP 13603]|uniref:HlyD family type I secretion periplasmic adaptor subunit n=1 Tax=Sphingomonas sp. CFBP 13603 TaxID=2774040 RepID=UPI001868B11B|nr:HlyD family type I secretion periplasmic adaptor subunit [Sphingomonas sp. CFBP 13603]MBE2993055.1 HlyD family type I secretion periplasmic adaptor subunit [Sphingomonas sp. CFBP 13603]